MNLENAKLLAKIAQFVQPLTRMATCRGIAALRETPVGCMMCEAARAGLIDPKEAGDQQWDLPDGFATKFQVTQNEAGKVLFPRPGKEFADGQDYFDLVKELLRTYGYDLEAIA